MNYEELVNRLTSKSFFSASAGLYRMRKILEHFGNPEDGIDFIHVAGTNGKGSVCIMLHNILKEAGYRVGLYTSPYIHDFRERIQVNGELIDKEELVFIGEEVLAYTEKLYEQPNQFELITIIAFLYFKRKCCDVVVLETGLGGTFDPTNVITKSLLSIITNIGFDHCAILGNTIEQIAAAKGGIIKQGGSVLLYPSEKAALEVLSAMALKQNARIYYVDKSDVKRGKPTTAEEKFQYKGISVELSLLGEHQCYNCATVLEAVRILNQGSFYIGDDTICNALKKTSWPGRMEKINRKPPIFIDGGHNPQGIQAVQAFIKERFPKKEHWYLVGILKDKAFSSMIEELKENGQRIGFLRFEHPRGFSEEEFYEVCEQYNLEPVTDLKSTAASWKKEAGSKAVICCTGSLYLADVFKKVWLEENQ